MEEEKKELPLCHGPYYILYNIHNGERSKIFLRENLKIRVGDLITLPTSGCDLSDKVFKIIDIIICDNKCTQIVYGCPILLREEKSNKLLND